MTAKEISRKDWDHILFETPDGLVLTVLCGTVFMFNVSIVLTAAETAWYEADAAYIDVLAGKIRDTPGDYSARRVPEP